MCTKPQYGASPGLPALILDYVNQENSWSSNRSTCQRKKRGVFAGYVRRSIYTSMDFQISEGLHRGPELSQLHHRL